MAAGPGWTKVALLPAVGKGLLWLKARDLDKGAVVRRQLGAGARGCHMTDPSPKMKTPGVFQSKGRQRLKPGKPVEKDPD